MDSDSEPLTARGQRMMPLIAQPEESLVDSVAAWGSETPKPKQRPNSDATSLHQPASSRTETFNIVGHHAPISPVI